MKILHITVHMGAGAGKAISGLAMSDSMNQHRIILLEKPEKTDHIRRCEEMGIETMVCPSKEQIAGEVYGADVVVLNWWHHPLIYRTLMEIADIPARIVLWSHVNGLNYPKLKPQFAKCFDACMFTSKASFHNEDWTKEEKEAIHKCSQLVYGMGDFEPQSCKSKKDYSVTQEIQVGYVGTLDYAKLHPDFVKWLKAVIEWNPKVKFLIAGDPASELVEDVEHAEISKNVEFLGFRTDISEILCQWDAFIYPLNLVNFATTENALLEAMAAGLPIVASDGIVEQSIIEDGKNGFLVSNENTFVEKLEQILENEDIRSNLGRSARQTVIEIYNKEANLAKFLDIINVVMKKTKKEHDFATVIGDGAFRWFLMGCGTEEAMLLEKIVQCRPQTEEWNNVIGRIKGLGRIYKGESKGSIKQFRRYYPEDNGLNILTNIM